MRLKDLRTWKIKNERKIWTIYAHEIRDCHEKNDTDQKNGPMIKSAQF